MKVCLVTPGQPASNPRLVKEADALVDAGHDVHVVASYFADWATDADRALVAARRWTMTFVDWRRDVSPALFYRSRLRHFAARTVTSWAPNAPSAATAALSRVGPELRKAVQVVSADLYVAHNLGALPIVGEVAAARSAAAAFDAEDFHSGQVADGLEPRAVAFIRAVERRWLPACAYVTAAAPAIAEAYRDQYAMPLPTTVLNVFPLRDRPAALRAHNPSEPLRLYWFSQTIGARRGLEEIVEAISRLRERRMELHLRGTWQHGFEAALRARAATLGLTGDRMVHHAPAAPDEMARLAAPYDIGLAVEPGTTLNNRLAVSNKLFTYLLAGNAVIATATPGQAALSSALGTAVAWCEPRSVVSLTDALARWDDDRLALTAARTEAWRLGSVRFNWDLERQRYLEVVTTALEARAGGGRAVRTVSAPALARSSPQA
jgi:glycosyltransferase involved in cell wall biosynthesis